jgi:hypothetical protein
MPTGRFESPVYIICALDDTTPTGKIWRGAHDADVANDDVPINPIDPAIVPTDTNTDAVTDPNPVLLPRRIISPAVVAANAGDIASCDPSIILGDPPPLESPNRNIPLLGILIKP